MDGRTNMDYSRLVPSLEWCKKLAEKGLCQENPQVWYSNEYRTLKNFNDWYTVNEWRVTTGTTPNSIIAPTLDVLLIEYRKTILNQETKTEVLRAVADFWWLILIWIIDGNHLPDAIAEAVWKGQP